jgi:hypothetical protein
VATGMIRNETTYRLFRPDLENRTGEDFEVATRTLRQAPRRRPGIRRHLQL